MLLPILIGSSTHAENKNVSSSVLDEILGSSAPAGGKVARLESLLGGPETYELVLGYIGRVDKKAEQDTAARLFSAPSAPYLQRLYAGTYLIKRLNYVPLLPQFKRFIVASALENGTDEFVASLKNNSLCAVGEYCALVSNSHGYKDVGDDLLINDELIPILKQCLTHVSEPEQRMLADGGLEGDIPKIERIQARIPMAFQALKCEAGIPAMKERLMKPGLFPIRRACAGALAVMVKDPATRLELKKYLLSQEKDGRIRQEYGKGLIRIGETDECVHYFRVKNLSAEFTLDLYQLETRLRELERIRSKNLKYFYQDLFKSKDFQKLCLVPVSQTRLRSLQVRCYRQFIGQLKKNNLKQFNSDILKIATKTKIKEIAKISKAHLNLKATRGM